MSSPHQKDVLTIIKNQLKEDFILIKRRPLVFKLFLAFCFLLFSFILGGGYYLFFYSSDILDFQGNPLNFEKLTKSDLRCSSFVYSSDNQIIGRFFYEVRDPVKYDEIPGLLINGFVAAEDQRFFYHPGIDVFAIGRAFIINTSHKIGFQYGKKAGASTIDQQLSRLLFADELPEFRTRQQSYARKIKEARVAIQLDKRYSKEQIMEGLLNRIYFGHGINGVSEACRYYFGKDIKKDSLVLREIAILVSINKSSNVFCPIFHAPVPPTIKPDDAEKEKIEAEKEYQKELAKETMRIILAKKRYNYVLERLLADRYITEADCAKSIFKEDEPIEIELLRITPIKNSQFGYSNRLVKEMLLMHGYTDDEIAYRGGLQIKTGIDSSIQAIVSEELNNHLAAINKEKADQKEQIEGAVAVIENKTGRIVALSGGHDFSETNFNRALSLRSPGSAFKPFTYAAAFEAGMGFDDVICNCPFTMAAKVNNKGQVTKWWSPRNFKESHPVPYGYIPLPTGIIRSVNLATLNLAKEIGIKTVIRTAHDMGIWGNRGIEKDSENQIWFKSPYANENSPGLQPYLPTAIGGSDVSLIELTNAFSVFARNGAYIKPSIITQIKDPVGKILYSQEQSKEKQVLSESTSRKMTVLLRAVTKIGTGRTALKNLKQPVAVKTGTSNGPNDLLMVGYTPEYSIGVRLGYDQPQAIEIPEYMQKVSGSRNLQVSGGWVAGPLFKKIVERMYEKRPIVEFPPEIESDLENLLTKYRAPAQTQPFNLAQGKPAPQTQKSN